MERLSKCCSTLVTLAFSDIVLQEICSRLENNSSEIRVEFRTISLVLVTLNESAWMLGIKYAEDVSVLFEKDSEDKSGKTGGISRDEVKMNESKAISDIGYEKYASEATEKYSNGEDKSKFQFSRLLCAINLFFSFVKVFLIDEDGQ